MSRDMFETGLDYQERKDKDEPLTDCLARSETFVKQKTGWRLASKMLPCMSQIMSIYC